MSKIEDSDDSSLCEKYYTFPKPPDGHRVRTSSALNVITRNMKLNTRLLELVPGGDVAQMTRLMREGASPNAMCRLNHVSACHIAAMYDNDALALLLESGADRFKSDLHGRTPLHLAAWTGNSKQILLLLNSPEGRRRTEGRFVEELPIEQVDGLLNQPCQPNEQFSEQDYWCGGTYHDCRTFTKRLPPFQQGWTALHAASACAQHHCVQLLLAAGADASVQDLLCRTPLDVVGYAHYLGHKIDVNNFEETVKLLLNTGAKFLKNHHQNKPLDSPLHTAVELESVAAVGLMLLNGASPTAWNRQGLTAMHICVQKQNKALLEMLAYHEDSDGNLVLVDTEDQTGSTVLCAAVKAEWMQGVRISLDAGANITIEKNRKSPLHIAAQLGNIDILRKILNIAKNKTINIDYYCADGQTALSKAIRHNHLDVVKLLLDNGFSIEAQNRDDANVFHVATQWGREEILAYLLKDIDIENEKDTKSKIIKSLINRNTWALHICFVLSLNIYALSLFWYKDREIEPVPSIFLSSVWIYIIYLTACLILMQEIIFITTCSKKIFQYIETWMSFVSITLAVILPQVVSWESTLSSEVERLFVSITLLFTWVKLMFLVSRFPLFGYYILMYGKVATKVFMILASFGCLIFGFASSFMILCHARQPFEGPWSAAVTTLVMMTSEFDYNALNKDHRESLAAIVVVRLMLLSFVIFVSIVLMNLLVGVAVNDINNLELVGNIQRLKKQVDFITTVEEIVKKILINLYKRAGSAKTGYLLRDWIGLCYRGVIIIKSNEIKCSGLPARLREAILERAQIQKKHSDDEQYEMKLNEIYKVIVKKDSGEPTKPSRPHDEMNNVFEELHKIRKLLKLRVVSRPRLRRHKLLRYPKVNKYESLQLGSPGRQT